MKIDRIKIEEVFPTGNFANLKLEASGSLEEGEDIIEAYKYARKKLNDAFRAINPVVTAPITQGEQVIPERQVDKGSASDVVKEIMACKDLKTLKTYVRIAQQKPEYLDAYNEQSLRLRDLPKKKNGKPALP